jgi:hypothetical protein
MISIQTQRVITSQGLTQRGTPVHKLEELWTTKSPSTSGPPAASRTLLVTSVAWTHSVLRPILK